MKGKRTTKCRQDIATSRIIFYFSDPSFVNELKEYYPKVYEAFVNSLKEYGKPEQCLMCEAYYWEPEGPACTLGGKITILDKAISCPLEEES